MCQLRCLILVLPSLAAGPGNRSACWLLCRSPVSPCEFDLYQYLDGGGIGEGFLFLAALHQFSQERGDAFQIFCCVVLLGLIFVPHAKALPAVAVDRGAMLTAV